MTKKDRELLLRDLCARLPYGFKVHRYSDNVDIDIDIENFSHFLEYSEDDEFKPYLRPMSSMTDKEKEHVKWCMDTVEDENYPDGYSPSAWDSMTDFTDYCIAHHLDYRGLIWRDLALEATKGMYE